MRARKNRARSRGIFRAWRVTSVSLFLPPQSVFPVEIRFLSRSLLPYPLLPVKTKLLASLLTLISPLFAAAQNCGCACCAGKEVCCCVSEPVAAKPAEAAKRHPLRGVITAVHEERSSLMVRHEEIPGVMRAMTMLFKVDDATLKSVRKGQAITGQMSRDGNDWWLHDVKVVAAPKSTS